MTHRPGKSCRRAGTKGQPEGFILKSKTWQLWVANTDWKTCYATGQNNSNPYFSHNNQRFIFTDMKSVIISWFTSWMMADR